MFLPRLVAAVEGALGADRLAVAPGRAGEQDLLIGAAAPDRADLNAASKLVAMRVLMVGPWQ